MSNLAHIADRVFNRPLLLHPTKANVILWVLGERIGADVPRPAPDANRFLGERKGAGRVWDYRNVQGAAVITIDGSLVNRGAWIGTDSGVVSYEGIEAQIAAAMSDPDVNAIVLDLDSPGGEATGMYGLAERISAANTVKPVVALVNDLAASAAYGIASQASRIVVSPTSIVGSIGVVLVHMDYSGAYAQKGINPTLIYAGDHKVDGHPFGPLSEDVQADLQREVMTFYDRFVEIVAAGRGDRLSVAEARATEARTYIGQEAIEIGLADQVGGLSDAVGLALALAGGDAVAGTDRADRPKQKTETPGSAAGSQKEIDMDWKDLTIEGLRQHRPELVTQIADGADISAKLDAAKTEGKVAGRAEGVQAERDRILGIEKTALSGHDALVAEMKADGKTTPEQAAMRINQAEQAKRAQTLQSLADADKEVGDVAASPGANADTAAAKPKATTPEGWKAEWEASADLQAQYPTVEAYVATMKHEARKAA